MNIDQIPGQLDITFSRGDDIALTFAFTGLTTSGKTFSLGDGLAAGFAGSTATLTIVDSATIVMLITHALSATVAAGPWSLSVCDTGTGLHVMKLLRGTMTPV